MEGSEMHLSKLERRNNLHDFPLDIIIANLHSHIYRRYTNIKK